MDKDCDDIVICLIAPSYIVNIGQDKIHINACRLRQCLGLHLGNLCIICGAHVVSTGGEIDGIASLFIRNDKRFAPRHQMGFKGNQPCRRLRSKEVVRTRVAFIPEFFDVSAP